MNFSILSPAAQGVAEATPCRNQGASRRNYQVKLQTTESLNTTEKHRNGNNPGGRSTTKA